MLLLLLLVVVMLILVVHMPLDGAGVRAVEVVGVTAHGTPSVHHRGPWWAHTRRASERRVKSRAVSILPEAPAGLAQHGLGQVGAALEGRFPNGLSVALQNGLLQFIGKA